jgi:rhodanese-related sulfurtransferase
MKTLLSMAGGLLLAASAYAGEFADITIADLKAAIAAKQVAVIDVNGTKSYNNGHVPGALNFEAVKDNLQASLPADKNTLIVAYCGGPRCKAYRKAAQAAQALGYTNVKHLPAGISGWKEAGEKTWKAK